MRGHRQTPPPTLALGLLLALAAHAAAEQHRRAPSKQPQLPPLHRPQPLAAVVRRHNLLLAASTSADLESGAEPVASEAPTKGRGGKRKLRQIIIAYLLWFVLPLSGAHHLYLGRNREALISSVSLGGFGLGWLFDAFRIPGYVRALALEQQQQEQGGQQAIGSSDSSAGGTATSSAAPSSSSSSSLEASEASTSVAGGGGADVPPSAVVSFQADGTVRPPDGARLGLLSSLARLVFRLLHRLALGGWFAFTVRLLLPEDYLSATPAAASAALLSSRPVRMAIYSILFALPAWAIVALTADADAMPWPARQDTWRVVAFMLAASALEMAFSLSSKKLPLHTGSLPLVAALCATVLRTWRKPPPRVVPRRSLRSGLLVFSASTLFWVLVAIGALMNVQVNLTVDGVARTLTGMQLLQCSSCALRPDRLVTMLRTLNEHICVKRHLEQALKVQFERVCVLPQQINRCFDWDVSGTRWQRVGLSLAESYRVLGLQKGKAKLKDVKAAFHKIALQNHPDKIALTVNAAGDGASAAAAEEAAMEFMKAQKAFERIMDHSKGKKPPPPPPKQKYPPRESPRRRTPPRRRPSSSSARGKAKK